MKIAHTRARWLLACELITVIKSTNDTRKVFVDCSQSVQGTRSQAGSTSTPYLEDLPLRHVG